MTQTTAQALLTILAISLVTLGTRILPFTLFPANKPTPKYILYLGRVLPYATIGMLVVYCLKNVTPTQYPYGVPELVAIAAIALLQSWRHNSLVSIGGGTLLFMVLIQVTI